MGIGYGRSFVALCWAMTILPTAHTQSDEPGGFVFTREFLQLTESAMGLCNVVYWSTKSSTEDPTLTWYRDEPDQALVTKIDDHCFGAFRGTVVYSWEDWQQNVKIGNSAVCATVGDGGCCDVQSGIYEAYFRTNYHQSFEDSLRDCATTCTDAPCPVVLTGHSQGCVKKK
jgi:Lipase (class 3)